MSIGGRLLATQTHRRVMMRFAERAGLIYFGAVDRDDDEQRIVRGLTTSPHYRDNHYMIGTYDDYDVAFVERSGVIKVPKSKPEPQQWLIIAVDLHTPHDLPHVFLGSQAHTQAFYLQFLTKFSYMMRLPLTTHEGYSERFLRYYVPYGRLADEAAIRHLFDPGLTTAIIDHFHELEVELSDNTLYLYAEKQVPTLPLLEHMLRYGVWLAQTIDERIAGK